MRLNLIKTNDDDFVTKFSFFHSSHSCMHKQKNSQFSLNAQWHRNVCEINGGDDDDDGTGNMHGYNCSFHRFCWFITMRAMHAKNCKTIELLDCRRKSHFHAWWWRRQRQRWRYIFGFIIKTDRYTQHFTHSLILFIFYASCVNERIVCAYIETSGAHVNR